MNGKYNDYSIGILKVVSSLQKFDTIHNIACTYFLHSNISKFLLPFLANLPFYSFCHETLKFSFKILTMTAYKNNQSTDNYNC